MIRTVPVGERPFGVTIDAAGRRAYTANVKSNDVSVIDIELGKTLAAVKVGQPALRGRARRWPCLRHRPVRPRRSASSTLKEPDSHQNRYSVGAYPEGIVADPSGRFVYVACWEDNTLERIDTESLEVTARVTVPDGPRAFGDFLR